MNHKQEEKQEDYDFCGGSFANGLCARFGGEPPAWIELEVPRHGMFGGTSYCTERFQLVRTEAGRTYVYVGGPDKVDIIT